MKNNKISNNISNYTPRDVISRGSNNKKKEGSEFMNPVLRVWSKNQAFDDSEFMFHKLGEWPDRYMLALRVNSVKPRISIDCVEKLKVKAKNSRFQAGSKGSDKKEAGEKSKAVTPSPFKNKSPSPWLFHSKNNSVFQPAIWRSS